ncbi:MAG: hypothetical protein ACM3JI_02650 [Anaerolineae bacterium]
MAISLTPSHQQFEAVLANLSARTASKNVRRYYKAELEGKGKLGIDALNCHFQVLNSMNEIPAQQKVDSVMNTFVAEMLKGSSTFDEMLEKSSISDVSQMLKGFSPKKFAKQNLVPPADEEAIYALIKRSVEVLAEKGEQRLQRNDKDILQKAIAVCKKFRRDCEDEDLELFGEAYKKFSSLKV